MRMGDWSSDVCSSDLKRKFSKRKLPFLFIIRFIRNFVSMKRKVSAANLSIAITFLLVLLSFGFGYRSYSQAEQRVVSDLNQALQRTVLQHKGLWLNADTIQTYAKLQEVMGTPVSVSGFHRAFTEALSITGLKDVSTLSLHILKKNAPDRKSTRLNSSHPSSSRMPSSA